jgi:AAA15 family ATPase/GTPase
MVIQLLSYADLGICDLIVEDAKTPDITRSLFEAARLGIPSIPREVAMPDTVPVVRLVHRVNEENMRFEPEQESKGTVAYLSLLIPILDVLRNGGLLCVDELDASLHPLIAPLIIRPFENPATNPRNAQLIFNTHDTNLLGTGVLRRDEVWFTEKGADGASHLYPLSDYKPRGEENLESGYLQGRYGAIPFIHPDYLAGNPGGNGEKS